MSPLRVRAAGGRLLWRLHLPRRAGETAARELVLVAQPRRPWVRRLVVHRPSLRPGRGTGTPSAA